MKAVFLFITTFVLFAGNLFAQSDVVTCQNRKYTLTGKKSLETTDELKIKSVYYGYVRDTLVITETHFDKKNILKAVWVQKMALADFAASSYTDGLGRTVYVRGTHNISCMSDSSSCSVNLTIGTNEKKAIRISDTGCTIDFNIPPSATNEKRVYVSFPGVREAEAFLAEFLAKCKKFEKK